MNTIQQRYPKSSCTTCKSSDALCLMTAKMGGGVQVFVIVCARCNKRTHDWVKYAREVKGIAVSGDFGWARTPNKCVHCGEPGTESHHVAPSHLFGKEARLWPQIDLCRVCHMRWHGELTPMMSRCQTPKPLPEIPIEAIQKIEARRSAQSQRPAPDQCEFCYTIGATVFQGWAPRVFKWNAYGGANLCRRCATRWRGHFALGETHEAI